jgi:antitoxin HicB
MKPQDYEVVIRPLSEEDGGGFLGTVPELPGRMSDGETRTDIRACLADAASIAEDPARFAAE